MADVTVITDNEPEAEPVEPAPEQEPLILPVATPEPEVLPEPDGAAEAAAVADAAASNAVADIAQTTIANLSEQVRSLTEQLADLQQQRVADAGEVAAAEVVSEEVEEVDSDTPPNRKHPWFRSFDELRGRI